MAGIGVWSLRVGKPCIYLQAMPGDYLLDMALLRCRMGGWEGGAEKMQTPMLWVWAFGDMRGMRGAWSSALCDTRRRRAPGAYSSRTFRLSCACRSANLGHGESFHLASSSIRQQDPLWRAPMGAFQWTSTQLVHSKAQSLLSHVRKQQPWAYNQQRWDRRDCMVWDDIELWWHSTYLRPKACSFLPFSEETRTSLPRGWFEIVTVLTSASGEVSRIYMTCQCHQAQWSRGFPAPWPLTQIHQM